MSHGLSALDRPVVGSKDSIGVSSNGWFWNQSHAVQVKIGNKETLFQGYFFFSNPSLYKEGPGPGGDAMDDALKIIDIDRLSWFS